MLIINRCMLLRDVFAWQGCFDLFSVCFQIVFASAISEGDVCAGINDKFKLDRESNVFIYLFIISSSPVYEKLLTCTFLTYACLLPRNNDASVPSACFNMFVCYYGCSRI